MSHYPYTESAERFAKETAEHQMTVLHNDGLYRHLRFKAPGNGFYWFDLITWPGTLVVRGDIDGYMFSRVSDMFEFFRSHRTPRDGHLEINPHYWSEKVEGGRDITKVYSEARFRQHVIESLKDAVEYGGVPRGLGKAIHEQILSDPDICHEDVARKLLDTFEHGEVYQAQCLTCRKMSDAHEMRDVARGWEAQHEATNPGHLTHIFTLPAFSFSDSWEWDLRDYNWSFLWACHAIVWGIAQYDARPPRWRRFLAALSPVRHLKSGGAR